MHDRRHLAHRVDRQVLRFQLRAAFEVDALQRVVRAQFLEQDQHAFGAGFGVVVQGHMAVGDGHGGIPR